MREIKFRAWDKELKYLGRVAELTYFPYGREIHEERIGYMRVQNAKKPSEVNHYTESEILNLVIEQYTGLKDVNGNEIYEGDIVFDTRVKDHNVVKFHKGTWTFNSSNDFIGYFDNELKVVGNIHENPELLEGE